MRSLTYRILFVGVALAGAVAARAQERTIKAEVPFNFYMGATAMPHGSYRVEELVNGHMVALRTAEGLKATTTWEIVGKSENEPPRLVFHCYGESCFLSEVWPGNGRVGMAIPRGARENELAKSGASLSLAVIKVAVQ
jgi:hypothetical protein